MKRKEKREYERYQKKKKNVTLLKQKFCRKFDCLMQN